MFKKFYLFSFILLAGALFGFVNKAEATDYNCCNYVSKAGQVVKCKSVISGASCGTEVVCIQYGEKTVRGGSGMAPIVTTEEVCLQEETITSQPVSCLSNNVCIASAFQITWGGTGPWSGIDIGQVVDLYMTANVKFKAVNPAGGTEVTEVPKDNKLQTTCINCSSEFVQVSNTFNTVNLNRFDTGKYYIASYMKQPPFEFQVSLEGTILEKKWFYAVLTEVDCNKNYITPETCKQNANMCFWWQQEGKCMSRTDISICPKLSKELCDRENPSGSKACVWSDTANRCLSPLEAGIEGSYKPPDEYYTEGSGIIPPCAFAGTCRSVNDLLQLVINAGKIVFSFVGAVAFVFFVYGGFTMILSFGNAEKTKKGRDILIAATVGIIIVLGAYLLVSFLLTAIGVEETFTAIK